MTPLQLGWIDTWRSEIKAGLLTLLHIPFLLRDEATMGLKAAALRYASTGSVAAAAALSRPQQTAAHPHGTAPWCSSRTRVLFVALKVLGGWAAARLEGRIVAEGWRRHNPLQPGEVLTQQQSWAMLFDTASAMWSFVSVHAYIRFLADGQYASPLHRLCTIRLVPESHEAAKSGRAPSTDIFMRDFIWREISVSTT